MAGYLKTLQCRKDAWQFARDFTGSADVHERALADSRTEFTFRGPCSPTLDEAWPKRVSAALRGLRWMYGAAIRGQKTTLILPSGKLTQAKDAEVTDHMTSFELSRCDSHIRGSPFKIRFGEIYPSAVPTALCTAFLTSKPHRRTAA